MCLALQPHAVHPAALCGPPCNRMWPKPLMSDHFAPGTTMIFLTLQDLPAPTPTPTPSPSPNPQLGTTKIFLQRRVWEACTRRQQEIHGRYTGDTREIYGRYTGDIREIYGSVRGGVHAPTAGAACRISHISRLLLPYTSP